jgi:MFS superfamily sulfate permease-like transporter
MLHEYHQQNVVIAMVKLNQTNQIMFKRAGLFQFIKQDHIFNKTIHALRFVEEELEDSDDSSSSDFGILLK